MPTSSLSWELVLFHCPSNCHTHPLQSWTGVAGGTFPAPDHEYPSYLELRLTATDAGGLTDTTTLRLDPRTVLLGFESLPTGLELTVGSSSTVTPFTREVIEGSNNTISASSPQALNGTLYTWSAWSDGGAASHNIVAPAGAMTYIATFAPPPPATSSGSTASSSSSSSTATACASPTARARSPGEAVRRPAARGRDPRDEPPAPGAGRLPDRSGPAPVRARRSRTCADGR